MVIEKTYALIPTGRVAMVRKGRVNFYLLKRPTRVKLSIPQWAKVRDLEELARELEKFFPKNLSAADMMNV